MFERSFTQEYQLSSLQSVATKSCYRCGKAKLLDDFPCDRKAQDGRHGMCKACRVAYANARYRRLRQENGGEYRQLLTDDEWREITARGTMDCRRCGRTQPLDEFRVSSRPPRRRRVCRDCSRRREAEVNHLKRAERWASYQRYRCRQFGITPEDYDRMVRDQQGLCAVCRRPLGPKGQTIDHCHQSGRVRGIVHSQCNLVIGNSGEDIHVLRGAIEYLMAHQRDGSVAPVPSASSSGTQTEKES